MVRFDAQQLHAAGDAAARPFAYSYWLLPGRLLAGAHPTARGSESAARHLQALHGQGITCCVDLTSTRDALPSYQPLHGRRLSFPIADYGLPGVDAMRATLDAIDSAMSAGESVYLHCRAGIGRTGTVAGCWLVEQGLDGDQALALLQRKFTAAAQSQFSAGSPETVAQCEFVRRWPAVDTATTIAP